VARRLARRGIEDPRLDAELLLAHVLGTDRPGLIAGSRDCVDREAGLRLARLVRRRRARIPLAYLLGHKEFWGLDFEVGPSVLVPRPDSELLVERAVGSFRSWKLEKTPASRFRVLDIGTGSGNLACAIASSCPGSTIVALDCSAAAIAVASRNVERLGLRDRIRLCEGDLADVSRTLASEQFEVIVSNPPYLQTGAREAPTVDPEVFHEPGIALFGEGLGYPAVYERLLDASEALLVDGGDLMVEVGQGQAADVRQRFARRHLFDGVSVYQDLAGVERVVQGRGRTR